jgi:hypothetical protein
MDRPGNRHHGTAAYRRECAGQSTIYYSRWIEVDVIKSTTSKVIIDRLEKHFALHGIPQTLRTDVPNLVSSEMTEFMDEIGVKQR